MTALSGQLGTLSFSFQEWRSFKSPYKCNYFAVEIHTYTYIYTYVFIFIDAAFKDKEDSQWEYKIRTLKSPLSINLNRPKCTRIQKFDRTSIFSYLPNSRARPRRGYPRSWGSKNSGLRGRLSKNNKPGDMWVEEMRAGMFKRTWWCRSVHWLRLFMYLLL